MRNGSLFSINIARNVDIISIIIDNNRSTKIL